MGYKYRLSLDETASVEPSGSMAWQHSTKQTLLAIPLERRLCFAQYIFENSPLKDHTYVVILR